MGIDIVEFCSGEEAEHVGGALAQTLVGDIVDRIEITLSEVRITLDPFGLGRCFRTTIDAKSPALFIMTPATLKRSGLAMRMVLETGTKPLQVHRALLPQLLFDGYAIAIMSAVRSSGTLAVLEAVGCECPQWRSKGSSSIAYAACCPIR